MARAIAEATHIKTEFASVLFQTISHEFKQFMNETMFKYADTEESREARKEAIAKLIDSYKQPQRFRITQAESAKIIKILEREGFETSYSAPDLDVHIAGHLIDVCRKVLVGLGIRSSSKIDDENPEIEIETKDIACSLVSLALWKTFWTFIGSRNPFAEAHEFLMEQGIYMKAKRNESDDGHIIIFSIVNSHIHASVSARASAPTSVPAPAPARARIIQHASIKKGKGWTKPVENVVTQEEHVAMQEERVVTQERVVKPSPQSIDAHSVPKSIDTVPSTYTVPSPYSVPSPYPPGFPLSFGQVPFLPGMYQPFGQGLYQPFGQLPHPLCGRGYLYPC